MMANPSWDHRRCSEDREALRKECEELRTQVAAFRALVKATEALAAYGDGSAEPGFNQLWEMWEQCRAAVEPFMGEA
jgi:hypothetical protein